MPNSASVPNLDNASGYRAIKETEKPQSTAVANYRQRIIRTLWLRWESFFCARLTPQDFTQLFFSPRGLFIVSLLDGLTERGLRFLGKGKFLFFLIAIYLTRIIHCHLIRFCLFWECFILQMHTCILKLSESNSTQKVSSVLRPIKEITFPVFFYLFQIW